MHWDDIRLLLLVARAGGVTAAAKRLGTSRTTVARRLAALEREVGEKLFDRTPSGLEPARIVVELSKTAEKMEVLAFDIERSLRGDESRPAGEVRLTATEALGSQFLSPHLAQFRIEHPEIALELVSESRTLSLARHEADIAIRLLAPDESTSVGKRLGDVAYCAYAHRDVVAADDAPLLGYSPAMAGPETAWLATRFARGAFVFRTNSTLALASAARARMGIAILPTFIGDAERTLRRVADAAEVPSSELWLVSHRDSRTSKRITAVRRFLIDLFRRHASDFSRRR